MPKIRQPAHAKDRADEIGDLISAACEKLSALSTEWFELNDQRGLEHARSMLSAGEVSLMLSVHQEASGLAHIAVHLLRTKIPMPRPYFEVQVPMLPWTLDSANTPFGDPRGSGDALPPAGFGNHRA